MIRALLLSAAAIGVVLAAPAHAADKKPPACAAISFRPLTGALTQGDVTAGHYRSRFGTIDLVGKVEGGQATDYRVQVNGQPLEPLKGEVPKSAYGCLKSKNVQTPPQPMGGACLGSRFRVAIDSSAKQKLIMLFGLQGDTWKLCQAGHPPAG